LTVTSFFTLGIDAMREGIHPQYFSAKVICAGCGSEFLTGSVMQEIRVGVCSNCHPFYTGKSRVLDTEGRVDQFQRKFGKFLQDKKDKKAPTGGVAAS
jgi:large subunit ribosomal protein L31